MNCSRLHRVGVGVLLSWTVLLAAPGAAPVGPLGPERALLDVLASDAAPQDKAEACRQLAMIGTPEAVPALAALLEDAHLGCYARIGLERIEDPAADAALMAALERLEGAALAGVINTLAIRRYAGAVPVLSTLAQDPASGVATEALAALGAISTDHAMRTIRQVLDEGPADLREASAHAALVAAEHLAQADRREEAGGIYDLLRHAEVSPHLRAAATRGTLLLQGEAGIPLLLEQLRSAEAGSRILGLRVAREIPGSAVTQALAEALEELPAEVQVSLIDALVEREDPAVKPAIQDLVSGADPWVRARALAALARVGDQASVPVLVKALAGPRDERQVALTALVQLRADGTDAALVQLAQEQDAPTRIAVMQVLATRGAADAKTLLYDQAGIGESEVMTAAYQALAKLGGEEDLSRILELLGGLEPGKTQDAAKGALVAIARRTQSEAALAGLLCEMPPRDRAVPERLARVSLLGNLHDTRALDALREALEDPDPAVRDAAVGQLAGWRDASALPVLQEIVARPDKAAHRTTALRGYVRLLGSNPDVPLSQRAAQLTQAMQSADRPEDVRMVLGGLHLAPHPATLGLALVAAEDEEIAQEAAWAIVRVAPAVAGSDPALARAALEKIVRGNQDPELTERAGALLRGIDGFEDYVLGWQVSPVYQQPGVDHLGLVDHPFEPERTDPSPPWGPVPVAADPGRPWLVDLGRLYPGNRHAAVYLRTWIYSPAPQPVRLEIGSDDGIKLWLNSEAVHANAVSRGLRPGEDVAEAAVQEGWNEILAKVVQDQGPWGLSLRLRTQDGTQIPGLRVNAFHDPGPEAETVLFDGKSLAGWEGNPRYWKVEDGAIVGHADEHVPGNEFLWASVEVADFYLSVRVKQDPHTANAGIQFRSKKLNDQGEALGYQADIGRGVWGRLYHERGRGKLDWTDRGERAVKPGDWNHYEILAVGPHIWTAVNGRLSVAMEDPEGERSGLIALQLHAGAPQTVRYKVEKLVHDPDMSLAGHGAEELVAALAQNRAPVPSAGREPGHTP